MLSYYLFLAWKGIRRAPGNSLIVVAGIALGVTIATLFSAIHHTYAKDPLPGRSQFIYNVRMDSWGPKDPHASGIPWNVTYRDMLGITKSDIPVRQVALFQSYLRVSRHNEPVRRFTNVLLCHGSLFPMFDFKFRHGSAWDRKSDELADPVVVIGERLNQEWFGGENSVGRTVTINGQEFRIIGVLERWDHAMASYYMMVEPAAPIDELFIPLRHVLPLKAEGTTGAGRWGPIPDDFEGRLMAEQHLVQIWVELPNDAALSAYKDFLDTYVRGQKQLGRFPRPIDNRVTPLREYMKICNRPPPEATAMMIAADIFHVACALGLVGLLLARFLSRTGEVGVRRALGASRMDIFLQHVIECEVIALVGGILGLVFAIGSIGLVNLWTRTLSYAGRQDFFRLDLDMAIFALVAALVAGLFAGVIPAYRVCRIAPAVHLKVW